jgi:hypothetical protein
MNSPSIGQPSNPEAGSYGCMAYDGNDGTQLLPPPKIPSNTNRCPVYGKTSDTITVPGYFSATDLDPWESRKLIAGADVYNRYVAGPAIEEGHMVTEVRRRLRGTVPPHNDSYLNRYSYYFTDSDTTINGEADWLRFLHPAGYFWTNKGLNNPFSAPSYYEQTGQYPTTTDVYCQNFIPFCDPMNVKDSGGTVQGQYIGYTFIFMFGYGYFKVPVAPNLAEDYYIDPQTTPATLVNPGNQFYSLDCHLYMVGNGVVSPKLQSIRYWFYNKFGAGYDPCSQYFYMINGDADSNWKFDVNFNLVGGGTQTIKFGLSDLQVYITP